MKCSVAASKSLFAPDIDVNTGWSDLKLVFRFIGIWII